RPVDIDVPSSNLARRTCDVPRRTGEDTGGERVAGVVRQCDGVIEVAGPQHGDHGTEQLVAGDLRAGWIVDFDERRADVPAALGRLTTQKDPALPCRAL